MIEKLGKGKVLCYTRGTKEERELQEEKIEEYCRENELVISGFLGFEVIPSIVNLWSHPLFQKHRPEGLVFTHMDRIARTRKEVIKFIDRALEDNLKIYVTDQPEISDLRTTKHILSFIYTIAEFEDDEAEEEESVQPTQLKIGDTVPIKEEHKELVKSFSDSVDAAQSGLRALSDQLRIAQRNLWKLLDKLYPETKEFVGVLDSENMVIRLGITRSELKKVPAEFRDAIIEAFSEGEE